MNTRDLIAILTGLIPLDSWVMPDLATFGCHLKDGVTPRGVSSALRSRLRLPAGPSVRCVDQTIIIASPKGRADIIARANCRVYGGDRYFWRRYLPGTDHAVIEADARKIIVAMHRVKIDRGTLTTPPAVAPPQPLPLPAPPPPLPRRASTSISGMPEPEFLRLLQDVQDDAGRRGVLQAAAVAPITAEAACDIVRAALPGLSVDVVAVLLEDILRVSLANMPADVARRTAARSAADVQRRREALQAQSEALQAELAALG